MAPRVALALAFALCLQLLALAAAAPSDFALSEESLEEGALEAQEAVEAESEEEAVAEQQRAGQEALTQTLDDERWQSDDADDDQGDAAIQEEYQLRDNSEQLTQQLEDSQVVQDNDEGSLSRLTADTQEFEQQTGQLQQQQQDEESGRLQQQQQQQQSGLPDRLVEEKPKPQPGYKPKDNDDDSGIIASNGGGTGDVRQTQPGNNPSQPRPDSYPQGRPPRPPTTPPADYKPQGSYGYLKVFVKPVTWAEALVTCLADGAMLAVPTSQSEAIAVGQFYAQHKSKVNKSTDRDLFFIGASDLHKEGEFATLLGTKLGKNDQWVRWQAGEPNNHKKVEHCVLSNDKAFYWDGNCQSKYAFVCQIKDRCQPRYDAFGNLQQPRDFQQQQQQQSQSRY